MSTVPTLPGIMPKMIDTPRIKLHALFSGAESGTPVCHAGVEFFAPLYQRQPQAAGRS